MSANPSGLPLVIGHRGSSSVAPENTIAAFTRALSDGADGIEFDVRLARDGVPVVIHDATLKRTAQRAGAVSDFTAAELEQIDVGSWFNEKHPTNAQSSYAHETIPSLSRLFEAMAGHDSRLYLELKSDGSDVERLAAAVVTLINDFSLIPRVIVESFHLPALQIVKELRSDIRTAALFEAQLQSPVALLRSRKAVALAVNVGADEIALHYSLAGGRIIDQAQKERLPVVVWTVDQPNWIRRAQSLGILAVITNDCAAMVRERSRLSAL
jgi:glycerophosphoryl diester phosphodiesterase